MQTFIQNLLYHQHQSLLSLFLIILIITLLIFLYIILSKNGFSTRLFPAIAITFSILPLLMLLQTGFTPSPISNSQPKTIVVSEITIANPVIIKDKNGDNYKVDIKKELKKGDKIKIQLETDDVWRLAKK